MPISRRSSGVQPLLGKPEGLTISRNNSQPNTRLDIGSGRAVIQAVNGLRHIAINLSAFTKRLDAAWTTGNGNGGRLTASIENNATYHVFLLRNDATGAIDFGLDTSVSGANRPAGWSSRIIGSWLTDGSGNLRNIIQVGDLFELAPSGSSDLSLTPNYSTSNSNLQTVSVPAGISVEGIFRAGASHASDPTAPLLIGTPGGVITAPFVVMVVGAFNVQVLRIRTNTTRQIVFYAGVAGTIVFLDTLGWYHPRGSL